MRRRRNLRLGSPAPPGAGLPVGHERRAGGPGAAILRSTGGALPAGLLALGILAACGSHEPPARRLYVTSGFTDQVLVLDAGTGRALDTLSLDLRPGELDEPHGVAVAPDGRHWYATLAHGEATLWKYETAGNRLVGRLTLPTPGASRVRITPDGRRAFVPDYWRSGMGRESRISVVELESLSLVGTPTVCPAPHDAVPDPRGERVAVTCSLGDELVILDARSLETLARVPVDQAAGPPGQPAFKPLNAVWAPEGDRVWVTLALADQVRAFSPSGQILGSVAVGDGPTQIDITPDGGLLVVPNRGDASVSLVDTHGLAEVRRIELEGAAHPHGVAVDPDGAVAYVAWEGSVETHGGVAAIRLRDGSVVWRTRAGVFTLGVAVGPPPG